MALLKITDTKRQFIYCRTLKLVHIGSQMPRRSMLNHIMEAKWSSNHTVSYLTLNKNILVWQQVLVSLNKPVVVVQHWPGGYLCCSGCPLPSRGWWLSLDWYSPSHRPAGSAASGPQWQTAERERWSAPAAPQRPGRTWRELWGS